MGLLTTITTRIGIPLAIAVGAGLLIAQFKDQIVGGISAGSSTIGQALSTPFGAFFTGLKSGFGNIPDTIDIKFPSFNFLFGEGADPAIDSQGNVPPNVLATDLDQGLVNLCRNSLGLLCFGGTGSTGAGGGTQSNQTQTQIFGSQTLSSPLTPFGDPDKRTFVDLLVLSPSSSRFLDLIRRERTTKGEIVEQGKFVGLFDFLSTQGRTERTPLTFAQVQQFEGQIRLSSQLFKEFGSVKEILAFA